MRPSARLVPQVAAGTACWVSQEMVAKDVQDRHHGCVPVGPTDGECEQLPRTRGGPASQRRKAAITRSRSVEVRGLNTSTIERAAPYGPILAAGRHRRERVGKLRPGFYMSYPETRKPPK